MNSQPKVEPKRRVREPRSNERLANSFGVWADLREAGQDATFDSCPVATRRDDVLAVLGDAELFVSGGRLDMGSSRDFIPQEIDPPYHRRYRQLLEPVFSPRSVRKMEPAIRAMAAELVEQVQEDGSCDFIRTVAMLAPRYFVLELLDMPESALPEMLRLKDATLHPEGSTDEERQATKLAAGAWIEELLAAAMEQRKQNLGDDLFSQIIEMRLDDDQLTDDEVLAIYYNFFIAGLDSVAAMTTMMFAFLATSPEHRRRIVEDPAVIPNAVEEMLRRETVVETVARVASRDCEFKGHQLHAGDQVVVALGAANHDPDLYPNAAEVDFDRNANQHFAFAAGIHRCLGSHLARLELAIVLEEWHKRIPDYWIPEGTELEWIDSPIRMVKTLPLEWKGTS